MTPLVLQNLSNERDKSLMQISRLTSSFSSDALDRSVLVKSVEWIVMIVSIDSELPHLSFYVFRRAPLSSTATVSGLRLLIHCMYFSTISEFLDTLDILAIMVSAYQLCFNRICSRQEVLFIHHL